MQKKLFIQKVLIIVLAVLFSVLLMAALLGKKDVSDSSQNQMVVQETHQTNNNFAVEGYAFGLLSGVFITILVLQTRKRLKTSN